MAVEQRVARLQEEIKREISQMIREEIKDPRVGFVSVTDVELTKDLRQAKVFVSILGDEAAQKASMDGLKSATGFIRSEIGARVRLRHTPELLFKRDTSIAHGAHIMSLLKEVQDGETGGE